MSYTKLTSEQDMCLRHLYGICGQEFQNIKRQLDRIIRLGKYDDSDRLFIQASLNTFKDELSTFYKL